MTDGQGCEQICVFDTKAYCLDDKKSPQNFEIYPNPVQDILTVEFDKDLESDTTFEVYDLLGNTVYTNNVKKNIGSKISIDFSGFPGNVYYLKVINENGTSIKKVILDK